MGRQQRIREGMFVRSADGARLGRIALVGERDFQIEKGSFFPSEYVASLDQVKGIRDDEVVLALDKDRFLKGDEPELPPPPPEVEPGAVDEDDAQRHERQLAEVRHEQHERYRLRHGEEWEWEAPSNPGSDDPDPESATATIVRETSVIEPGESGKGDRFRSHGVSASHDEDEGDVAKAWQQHDIAVGKRHERHESRYATSDLDPSGLRLEKRNKKD